MKTFFPFAFSAGLFICKSAALAQFTVAYTFPGQLTSLHSLSSGVKYRGFTDYASGTLTVYDLDVQVYRVLNFPAPPAGHGWNHISYITEDLFDNDPTTIEFLLRSTDLNGPGAPWVYVAREDGTILHSQYPGYMPTDGTAGINHGQHIFIAGETTYMMVQEGLSSGPVTIYELPGRLPCQECNVDLNVGMQGVSYPEQGIFILPNPASTEATFVVPAELLQRATMLMLMDARGKTVQQIPLNGNTPIVVNISNLAAGTYTCHFISGNVVKMCGRLVVSR